MFRFGLNNLRRLKDVPEVDIRPITLLVGRNSSGKSTFLRSFPLLRQSLLTRTSSPILWYGDYVDFGSFEGAVSDNDVDQPITFKFGLDNVSYVKTTPYNVFMHRNQQDVGHVSLTVSIRTIESRTYLQAFTIYFDEGRSKFDVQLSEKGHIERISVNGSNIQSSFSEIQLYVQLGSIFPYVRAFPKKVDESLGLFMHRDDPLVSKVASAIKPHLNNKLQKAKLEAAAADFLAMRGFSEAELRKLENRTGVASFRKLIGEVRSGSSPRVAEELRRLFLTSTFVPICEAVFDRLRKILSQTLYIGPVRARSERYYRYQDLAVSEIDPDGQNFPMFLNSLRPTQLRAFSDWVRARFDYGVELSKPQEHISINLVVDDKVTNIVDNGYGISQVLPVLGQIWWAANRPKDAIRISEETATPIIAIEQPELHLHPAHQALLADALIPENSDDQSEPLRKLHFIIETHSESLVNRIGELISIGKIAPQDVQILLFEKDFTDDRATVIKRADFDERGVLNNWPYGFFQPDPA